MGGGNRPDKEFRCRACKGYGYNRCPFCEGKGVLYHRKYKLPIGPVLSVTECQHCDIETDKSNKQYRTGRILCALCQGTGVEARPNDRFHEWMSGLLKDPTQEDPAPPTWPPRSRH